MALAHSTIRGALTFLNPPYLLARMERLGWLKSRTNPRGGKRARKDYRLTANGRSVLELVRDQIRELYVTVQVSGSSGRG